MCNQKRAAVRHQLERRVYLQVLEIAEKGDVNDAKVGTDILTNIQNQLIFLARNYDIRIVTEFSDNLMIYLQCNKVIICGNFC
jgi:hypothetical protein